MKKLIQIQFAAALAGALCMGGLARGQTSEVSGEATKAQSPRVAPASADALPDPESLPPEAAAFVYYFRIQLALAQDSLTNVALNARALAEVVRKDTTGSFPTQLADQANGLARDAVSLAGARLDFAIVSGQLMNYLKVRNPPVGLGPIHRVLDPETKLYWLQTGDLLQNPYLGKSWGRSGTYVR
jgi:hypothetical protein